MTDLARFVLDSGNNGVYAAPASATALKQAAAECGLAWFDLDLTEVAGKAAFLVRCQTAFRLPRSFGYNWDALADSLRDLSWERARGYIVFCHNGKVLARDAAQVLDVAIEILVTAATYWQSQRKPFFALLDADTRGARKLKRWLDSDDAT
jgi:hypothetical protein